MSSLLLTGGRVIDPSQGLDTRADILIVDGKIVAVGPEAASQAGPECPSLELGGLVACPGLIDLHVHLREPGQTGKETIATGTLAAARGGFTSILCMPNTTPAVDSPSTVVLIQEKAEREGAVNVFVAGAISRGLAGRKWRR